MWPTAGLARALVRPATVCTAVIPGGNGGGDGGDGCDGGDGGGQGGGGEGEGGGGEGGGWACCSSRRWLGVRGVRGGI
jgi:hypothetical protein